MSKKSEVYLYGQILGTHSFLLKDGFLQPDEYSEIKEQYFLPGGETGTAATVLASLGVSVIMDGTWIGKVGRPVFASLYAGRPRSYGLCSHSRTGTFTDGPVPDFVLIREKMVEHS